ncbi:MAG: group I intron-associated PD-(D/E)XK endonuclease [Candidatus Omnitrophica bacterium]|nr:group I intron-associated PD-(D/E)XK endonuclease [Candidatus Omnitrophota bacterium]
MNSFKELAYQVLKEVGKPLHSKEITRIAIERGLLKTAGKTPEATMNAQLVVDINVKKERSRFNKTGASTFALNEMFVPPRSVEAPVHKKICKITKNISTKQKGDIAEARIAELVTLYGETCLSCYKPISDDEGIDLIVKEKGSFRTMYIQIKSRFGDDPGEIFTSTTKSSSIADNYSVAVIFCYFDTTKGDLHDDLWFVPAPDLLKRANQLSKGRMLGFVAGRKRKESNKWDSYIIDKRDLANQIIAQMKRI